MSADLTDLQEARRLRGRRRPNPGTSSQPTEPRARRRRPRRHRLRDRPNSGTAARRHGRPYPMDGTPRCSRQNFGIGSWASAFG